MYVQILGYFMEKIFCTCINVNVSVNIFCLYMVRFSFYKYKSFNNLLSLRQINNKLSDGAFWVQRGYYTKTLRRKSKLTLNERRGQFIHVETFKLVSLAKLNWWMDYALCFRINISIDIRINWKAILKKLV